MGSKGKRTQFIFFGILLTCLFLAGCRSSTKSEEGFHLTEKECSEVIVNSLNQKDKAGIKALLCQRSRELKDIDKQIDAVFERLGDAKISSYKIQSLDSGESKANGSVKEKYQRWAMEKTTTEEDQEFELTVKKCERMKRDRKREGLYYIELESMSDGRVYKIGYDWLDYYDEASGVAKEVIDSIEEKGAVYLEMLFCEEAQSNSDLKKHVAKTIYFYQGTALRGKNKDSSADYDGKYDYHSEVNEIETVKNGQPIAIKVTNTISNIMTDADEVYQIKLKMYLRNDDQLELEGITQMVIEDETGKKITLGIE